MPLEHLQEQHFRLKMWMNSGRTFGKMASAFGNNIWQILALVACMLILMLGVGSGIEKANKIMMRYSSHCS